MFRDLVTTCKIFLAAFGLLCSSTISCPVLHVVYSLLRLLASPAASATASAAGTQAQR